MCSLFVAAGNSEILLIGRSGRESNTVYIIDKLGVDVAVGAEYIKARTSRRTADLRTDASVTLKPCLIGVRSCDLKSKLSKGSRVSIAAASFSIYAFEALKEELENVDELRFIFTSPTFIKDKVKKEKREFFIPKLNRERNLYGSDFEIKLRNKLEQKAIAKECANWIRRKVKFKSNVSQESMGGFIHVNGTAPYAYAPFNEFTTTELGCERGNSLYSMVQVVPSPFAD